MKEVEYRGKRIYDDKWIFGNLVIDKHIEMHIVPIEYFYEDNAYKYYFTCIKSSSMYLLIDGKEYPLKEALNNKVTTIKELEENNGIKFLKQSKNLVTK